MDNHNLHHHRQKPKQEKPFEDTFDSYDDFSLKKKVKPNEGQNVIEYPSNQRQNHPYPPTKPQYPQSVEKRFKPQEQHQHNRNIHQRNPPPSRPQVNLSEDFIPLNSDTPEKPKQNTRDNYEKDYQNFPNYQNQPREYHPQQRDRNDRDYMRVPDEPSYRDEDDGIVDFDYLKKQKERRDNNNQNYRSDRQYNQRDNYQDNRSNYQRYDNRRNSPPRGYNNDRRDNRQYNDNRYEDRRNDNYRDNRNNDWNNNRNSGWNNKDSRDNDWNNNRNNNWNNRDNDNNRNNDWNNNRNSGWNNRDNEDNNRNNDWNNNSRNNEWNNNRDNRNNEWSSNRNNSRNDGAFGQGRKPRLSGLQSKTTQLPIFPFKSEIVQSIATEQVTIISGDTGCGKSTQIPKYILEDCMKRGSACRIICTQPRRIAAITLAKRVQDEISEMYPMANPRTVGYHIGMETNFNKDSKIIFVTNGIFLQRFIHEDENTDGGILRDFTHVILDEIHERDIDSDFIMVALKHVLSKHKNFKLILMSATINSALFSKYFSKNEIDRVSNYFFDFRNNNKGPLHEWGDVAPKWEKPADKEQDIMFQEQIKNRYKISAESTWGDPSDSKIEVEAPVVTQEKEEIILEHDDQKANVIEINQNYVDQSQKFEIYTKYLDHLKRDFDVKCTLMGSDFSKKKAIFHDECIKVCLQLIAFLTSSRNNIESEIRQSIAEEEEEERRMRSNGMKWPEGKKRHYLPYMLIFLPGLSEIYHLMDVISADKTLINNNLDLIPLHSTLSDFNSERLFKDPEHSNQRKIILSTNIAESSITIPNVLYVIDFCLLKEINSSGRNNIEVLDLVWASKASIRQRAGRTGRVADGYVFRLIPEYFYEKELDAFSKPELHRSPLDKLILRIKTLHESEKIAKAPENYLFENPKEVLGRAIEPPQLESIALAARNLQDNGALTTVTEGQGNLGEITFLGKVFCDLPCDVKVSRMILLGLAFGLKEEIVSLAAILGQRKSIFKSDTKAVPRNRYAYMKNLWNMSDGTKSDHIALLRTYAAWEKKFVSSSMTVKNFRKRREKFDEREYCQERQLDNSVLRETYVTKQDIISRLKKLDILKKDSDLILDEEDKVAERKYFWDDPELDRSKINEKYAMMKFILAGAFYITYIKPSEFKRQVDTNQANYIKTNTGMDPLKTIVIRHTHRGVENWPADKVAATKQNWFKMLNKFNPEEIKFIQDKAYISFGNNDYEFSLKALDYIKKSYYDISRQISVYNKEAGSNVREEITFNHTSKNHSNIFYSHWMDPDCVALFAGLGEVEYFNAYEFVDFLTRKRIKIDPDSINNVVPVENPANPVCLVTQDYFEKKSGILSSKYTTLLDSEYFECKFLIPLITLIFAPQVSLEADEAKTRYKSMVIDGTEIEFDFYLTQKDIEEINEIRNLLQDFFVNKDRNSFQNTYFSLWQAIRDLFKKERVLYIPQEKWEDNFKQEYGDKLYKVAMESQSKRQRKPANKNASVMATSIHFYLNPIKAKDLPNARFANYAVAQDAAKESQKYYSLYMDWKKTKLIQIKKSLRLVDQKITYLACATCGTKLCDFTCIGEEIINGFYRHLRCSEFIFKVMACSSGDPFYQTWHLDKIKNHKFLHHGEYISHTVLGCYQNHEIALKVSHRDLSKLTPDQRLDLYKRNNGVKIEGEGSNLPPMSSFPAVENLFITRYSKLLLVFPDDTQEPFDFDTFDKETLTIRNQSKLEERERKLQNLSCPICQISHFDTKEDFKAHQKNKYHLEEYRKFVDNLTEIPE